MLQITGNLLNMGKQFCLLLKQSNLFSLLTHLLKTTLYLKHFHNRHAF